MKACKFSNLIYLHSDTWWDSGICWKNILYHGPLVWQKLGALHGYHHTLDWAHENSNFCWHQLCPQAMFWPCWFFTMFLGATLVNILLRHSSMYLIALKSPTRYVLMSILYHNHSKFNLGLDWMGNFGQCIQQWHIYGSPGARFIGLWHPVWLYWTTNSVRISFLHSLDLFFIGYIVFQRCFPHIVNLACQAVLKLIMNMEFAAEDATNYIPVPGVDWDPIAMIWTVVRVVSLFITSVRATAEVDLTNI